MKPDFWKSYPMGTGEERGYDIASQLAGKTYALLTLRRRIVGIRFARTEREYGEMPARDMKAKVAYCVVVRSAMSGRSLKLSREFSGCNGGSRALGFEAPGPEYTTGERFNRFGLYQDLETSRQVAACVTLCRRSCHGVMARPLEDYRDGPPDVVTPAADPLNAMRVVQGYTCNHGCLSDFRMTGNQGSASNAPLIPLNPAG